VAKDSFKVIVGLGQTGYSVTSYLSSAGVDYRVIDDNPAPARLSDLLVLKPTIEVMPMELGLLLQAEEIIVSPGVPLSLPEIQSAMQQGIPVTGDVAMFGGLAKAPIIAITGSNGKSTVTSMVGACAIDQISETRIAGNIGTPCLDVLDDQAELYVIEVSSFQLELATRLPVKVAVVLNLSPDHLDRYENVDDYYNVKLNLYEHCEVAVLNREIAYEFEIPAVQKITFGTDVPPTDIDFGLRQTATGPALYQGQNELVQASELKQKGKHNIQNALAALAIGYAADLKVSGMVSSLLEFEGLPHRCEQVGSINGAAYINDSKATNVGASISAIESFGEGKNIILILGGEGKGGDFSPMSDSVSKHVKKLLVFGQDKELIERTLSSFAPVEICRDVQAILEAAIESARVGDIVLFSPACASFDMFENYMDRGDQFRRLVLERAS
jgi:UDP-N-acetylmuramoylalanine--D-glutamate ligase